MESNRDRHVIPTCSLYVHVLYMHVLYKCPMLLRTCIIHRHIPPHCWAACDWFGDKELGRGR